MTFFELEPIDDISYDVSEGLITIAELTSNFDPEICARPSTFTYLIDGGISAIDGIVQLDGNELNIDAGGVFGYEGTYSIEVTATTDGFIS